MTLYLNSLATVVRLWTNKIKILADKMKRGVQSDFFHSAVIMTEIDCLDRERGSDCKPRTELLVLTVN